MADDNPRGPNGDGDGGDDPSAKYHSLVAAINALKKSYECTQKNRTEHDGKTLFWSRFAAGGVGIYTFLTVIIAVAAICSTKLTRENFIVDQRPYVWLTNDLGKPTYFNPKGGGVQILWTWYYTNYGKTPALGITFDQFIRLGADNQFGRPRGYKGPGVGSPLPPGKNDHVTVVSEVISAADADKFASKDYGITIAAVINYKDGHGRPYETNFCIGRLLTGDIAYLLPAENCHNDMK